MAAYDEHHIIEDTHEPLGHAQRAWCVIMLAVMLGSVTVLGIFVEDRLHPENPPVVRLKLADLTPQPGFDI